MSKIDTDMVAAYFRSIENACKKVNDRIEEMEKEITKLQWQNEDQHKTIEADAEASNRWTRERIKLNDRIKELEEQVKQLELDNEMQGKWIDRLKDSQSQWHPASEVPTDDTKCIVRTKDGATYFLSPINGKWLKDVTHWMYIPQVPLN